MNLRGLASARVEGLYSAFGLTLRTAIPMPWAFDEPPLGNPEVTLLLEASPASEGRSGELLWATTFPGGRGVRVERLASEELRIRYGDLAAFLISADALEVRCTPVDATAPSWLRFLLDTVLGWTAMSHGLELLHASAVELNAGVCAFASGTGGGKSTLAGELMLRGAKLFADDIVAMSSGERPLAHPGPPLTNIALDRPDLIRLGRPIAVLHEGESEAWVSVAHAGRSPLPVTAIFFLRRAADLEFAVREIPANMLALVPHIWAPQSDSRGARNRFSVLADVAGGARMFHLDAPLSTPPAVLADGVERALETEP